MIKPVALGISNFEDMIKSDVFYVDKTYFIRDWWNQKDKVTLITRPRRFGKTLTLSMAESFFSCQYKDSFRLFENLSIWNDESLRSIQGTFPVIHVSFANVKPKTFSSMMMIMKMLVSELYGKYGYLLDSNALTRYEKQCFSELKEMRANEEQYLQAILFLSKCLSNHFKKNTIILIDEYDTPMLEAYVAGYWEEAITWIRRFFHAALKDNPYLERGLMTGITRVTQESVFSDLNNLRVVTTTKNLYASCFGFTEAEVFDALKIYGLWERRDEVKKWYDGFQFGSTSDIYNPWSILNFLSERKLEPYWMNTSGNELVGKLVRNGMLDVKQEFEILLQGDSIVTEIDESITYSELEEDPRAVWSWFLTTGYMKIISKQGRGYEVALTNYEVRLAFYRMVEKWFGKAYSYYKSFRNMLLKGDLEGMQGYMERVTMQTFSYFDVGNESQESERTEQFYHGFTIGLIADLNDTHVVTSNRESGFGRYDVCIEPLDKTSDGIIIEFKVFDPKKEKTLEETAQRALSQIYDRNYEADLKARGIKKIRKYGFAFRGKKVLIAEAQS